MKTFVLLTAALILPHSLAAQRPPWLNDYLKPAVYGRITDSASGVPIPGMRIRVDGMTGIAGSDTAGWYLLFGQQPGVRRVSFYCPTRRRLSWRKVTERAVNIGPHTDSLVNFQMTLTGCVEPPVHTWTAEFRGHYTFGFESSDFTPCENKLERLDGTAYDGEKQYVWIETFARDAVKGITWPEKNDPYYPKYYVRWLATVTGPGSYGHMGVGMYQMRVDRVLEARDPRANDCQ